MKPVATTVCRTRKHLKTPLLSCVNIIGMLCHQIFTHPALSFLKAMRIFDIRQVLLVVSDDLVIHIIGLDDHKVLTELAAYMAVANEVPAKTSTSGNWFANLELLSMLSSIAQQFLSVPISNGDAKCSASLYSTVNVPQRQRLSKDNLADKVILTKR